MAAKRPKPGRGRGKTPADGDVEPSAEPTTSPEAPWPPEDEAVGGAETPPTAAATVSEDRGEDSTSFEPVEPIGPAAPRRPEEPATWRASHLAIAGLTVVVVAAALAGVLYYVTGDADRLDLLATQSETQSRRLDSVEDAIGGLQSGVGQVTTAVGQVEASLTEIQAAMEDMRSAIAASPDGTATGELRDELARMNERLASLEQGGNFDELTASIARLEQEIAEMRQQGAERTQQAGRLEEEIAALRQQAAERTEQAEAATALGRAYAALTERVAAGAPFAEELEAVTAELPGAPGLEALRPHSGEGVPTVMGLQAQLAGIAAEMPGEVSNDTDAAAGDGLWDTMRQRVEGMVSVRRADETDWQAVLRRAEEALQAGDLDAAIAEVEQAGEAAPAEIGSWLADARARRDVEAALDELSDAVLRQFAGRQ